MEQVKLSINLNSQVATVQQRASHLLAHSGSITDFYTTNEIPVRMIAEQLP
jgi:hypothetical protein